MRSTLLNKVSALFSALFLLGVLTVNAQETWSYQAPKGYLIHPVSENMTMDGIANESIWSEVPWTDYFEDIQGDKMPLPRFKTRVKMAWDKDFIYFLAEMEEPHVWGDITKRDAVVFHNNDFEIFIRPGLYATHYAEFEINALGTVWDLMLMNAYREGGPVINSWDMADLKTGINIDGTLNDASDIDRGWTVEVALPWSAISELRYPDYRPKEGDQWRLNFSRVQWQHQLDKGKYGKKKNAQGRNLPEDNWTWSPQGVINMHQPESWGYLQFTHKAPGEVSFVRDAEEGVQQLLFHLYRQQRVYRGKHGHFADDVIKLNAQSVEVNGVVYKPQLAITQMGYEISIRNPKTGKLSIVNQKGQLIQSKQ